MDTVSVQPQRSPQHEVADRTGIKAGFISRAVAFVIDLFLILVLVGATYVLTNGTFRLMRIDISECTQFVPLVDFRSAIDNLCALSRILVLVILLSIAPTYFLSLWLFAGRTVGMGIAGLRVVRTNGKRLRLVTALVRLAGFTLSILTLGLGFLWAIFDDDRQALHDKLAGTYVIYWTGTMLHPKPPLPAKPATSPAPFGALGSTNGDASILDSPEGVHEETAHA